MLIDRELLESVQWHPLTLSFRDKRLETCYRQYRLPALKFQARIALLVGGILYGLYGLMDFYFIPPESFLKAIYILAMVLVIAFSVFGLSYFRNFSRLNQWMLSVVGFFASFGLLGKMTYLSLEGINLFYPGLILIIFWNHYFSGLRFVYATSISLVSLLIFNLMFSELPFFSLFSHNFFIISANIMGAFASYTSEQQSRTLFLREQQLDAERQHQHERALHDRLTGLPNRELLMDRIEQAVNFAVRNDQVCAGLFLDLDNFKPINDTYGHAVGDQVLQEVTRRFLQVMRETDTLSRLGGDEFFVLAKNIQNEAAAKALANKLLQQLEIAINVQNIPPIVDLSASIGIAMFPYKDATPIDIIRRADHAMYEAKRMNKAGVAVASMG